MGIIQRQTIKGSAYSYAGAIIGFVTTGLLLPHLCSKAENGLLVLLIQFSILASQVFSLGATNIAGRFFPYFRTSDRRHNGFLFLMLSLAVAGSILFILFFWMFQPLLIRKYADSAPLFTQYLYLLIPLTLFTLFFNILDAYNRGLYNSVTGLLIKEIIQRLFIFGGLAALYFSLISFEEFLILYIIAHCIPAILIILFLIWKQQFYVHPEVRYARRLGKYISIFAAISLFAGFSSLMVNTIDNAMLAFYKGLDDTGIYGRMFVFGTIIAIPGRTMNRAISILIADAWKRKDLAYIDKLYRQTCLTQLIIGLLLFIGIWGNIHNILKMLPPDYAAGKYVILLVGLSNIFDMATGINGLVIVTSPYYRFDFYFMGLLIFFAVLTNWLLIPLYGITGAALATGLTIFLFNLTRVLFLKIKFGMFPFNRRTLIVAGIGLLTLGCSYLLPDLGSLIPDILFRSVIMTGIYSAGIYFSAVSPEMNTRINKALSLIFKR